MARVSLLNPSDGLVYNFKRNKTRRMPLGLAYIAAALDQAGHEVSIVDGALHDYSVEEIAERGLETNPDFVGLGCTTPLFHQAATIIDTVKNISPSTIVGIGGPHVSALPYPTLRNSKADVVFVGEGEESVVSVLDRMKSGQDFSDIPGIAFRSGNDPVMTQQYRTRIHQDKAVTAKAIDLDKVPMPARHLFEYDQYVDIARDIEGPQTGTVYTRGCPGKCGFCGAANTLVRARSIDNIIEEFKVIKELGIKNVFVMDDTYTNRKSRVLELSRRIAEGDFGMNISVQLRLDQIDKEVCDAMYASGVRYVGPGIESGNEAIIKAIGKGPRESKDHMLRKIRLLQEYDWKIRCSYVMGMVDETEEQIMETIEFAKLLGADENAFSILVPYPDSPLWAYAKEKGLVHDDMDFSKFLYYQSIGCNLSAVPTERLLELHKFAYEHVGNPAYRYDDDSATSGNRPHIPYLLSEEFKMFRERQIAQKDALLNVGKGLISDIE